MNLVIITSILSPSSYPLSYTNIRSVYTIEERFLQTIETIKSVRERIPDNEIVILECSPDTEWLQKLQGSVEHFKNYYQEPTVHAAVSGPFKGFGECKILSTFFEEVISSENIYKKYKNFFKVSGRYRLNENFDYQQFNNEKSVFRPCDLGSQIINTILYKISHQDMIEFYENILKKSMDVLSNGQSVENVFYFFIRLSSLNLGEKSNKKYGITGNCSVDGALIEY